MQFGVMVTGSRSKVTSTQIFCLTNLFPRYILTPNINKKIFIRLGDTESGKEFCYQGYRVKVKGHIDTILSRNTPLSPDTSSMQNLAALKELQSGHEIVDSRPPDFQDGRLETRK
jgi:hypothetical protein